MRLDEVRELKRALSARGEGVAPAAVDPSTGGPAPATVFFGVVPSDREDGYRLAVRLTATDDETLAWVEALRERIGDDVDVRRVGEVRALTSAAAESGDMTAAAADPGTIVTRPGRPPTEPPDVTPEQLQQRLRPLIRGASVAHEDVTAGTIGAFVRLADDDATYVLSNNHVLANSSRGRPGDRVMQPGPYDGGGDDDVIGQLARAVPLDRSGTNVVDAALAKLEPDVEVDLEGFDGALTGVVDVAELREPVRKIGRTTAITDGRVTAVEVDQVPIGYEIGTLVFDDQIEIEGVDAPFSAGGDSGSLIYEPGSHGGVGLLFAGSETGGPGGHGLTYANPLPAVLEALGATLST
jgi:hypothetical protein